ncbi:hypothetical protein I6A60_00245 [Frankia sp. AgB1.9]|uniref:hypothetical protein n=1 Tax=unclassified Frankia TaxID=2632575 RepID=UPI00193185A1|nr:MULTISPECIES: hypothetical protein [unclassified Frankia]MBL7546317.1 hypothetical protein [Frankia sp. AgB1.9]
MAYRLAQDSERDDLGANLWDNGILPDNEGRFVHLEGLMFTKPDSSHLAPEYITAHMQVIAKRAGLCCALVRDADPGATTLVVGNRHAEPVGTSTPMWIVSRSAR